MTSPPPEDHRMQTFKDVVTAQGGRVITLLISGLITAFLLRVAARLVDRLIRVRTPRLEFGRAYLIGLLHGLAHWGVHAAFVAAAGERQLPIVEGVFSVPLGIVATMPVSFFVVAGLLIRPCGMSLGRACLVAFAYELLTIAVMLAVLLFAMADRYLI